MCLVCQLWLERSDRGDKRQGAQRVLGFTSTAPARSLGLIEEIDL